MRNFKSVWFGCLRACVFITAFLLPLLLQPAAEAQVIGEAEDFPFRISLQPVEVPEMPPIHSYAFAVSGDDILIVGGRIDGLHARQPFAAFPLASNNQQLIVVNPAQGLVWTAPLSGLPVSQREQLQSTNMIFFQLADTLYVMGGYAYAPSADNHITFPYLTTIQVSQLIAGVKAGFADPAAVRQLEDERFANTGGQMGSLNGQLLLVGGNTFTGRYNPMGNPTYVQVYQPHMQFFEIDNSGPAPVLVSHSKITDEQHLRRRDFNLLPYQFTDGRAGYLVSAGVFRQDALLPYLYPVEIDEAGFFPHEGTEQLLSHYHSPKLSLLDAEGELHMIFFGGLAQYYYENGTLIQDNRVPFVNTISRFTRYTDGSFAEFVMPERMPDLKGTNAEFIPAGGLPQTETGVFLLSETASEHSLRLGYIIGGINTPERNPFTQNRTQFTSASSSVYEVILEREPATTLPVSLPQQIALNQNYPNPFNPVTTISFVLPEPAAVRLEVYNMLGAKVATLYDGFAESGLNNVRFDGSALASGIYLYRLQTAETSLSRRMLLVK